MLQFPRMAIRRDAAGASTVTRVQHGSIEAAKLVHTLQLSADGTRLGVLADKSMLVVDLTEDEPKVTGTRCVCLCARLPLGRCPTRSAPTSRLVQGDIAPRDGTGFWLSGGNRL